MSDQMMEQALEEYELGALPRHLQFPLRPAGASADSLRMYPILDVGVNRTVIVRRGAAPQYVEYRGPIVTTTVHQDVIHLTVQFGEDAGG